MGKYHFYFIIYHIYWNSHRSSIMCFSAKWKIALKKKLEMLNKISQTSFKCNFKMLEMKGNPQRQQ